MDMSQIDGDKVGVGVIAILALGYLLRLIDVHLKSTVAAILGLSGKIDKVAELVSANGAHVTRLADQIGELRDDVTPLPRSVPLPSTRYQTQPGQTRAAQTPALGRPAKGEPR